MIPSSSSPAPTDTSTSHSSISAGSSSTSSESMSTENWRGEKGHSLCLPLETSSSSFLSQPGQHCGLTSCQEAVLRDWKELLSDH